MGVGKFIRAKRQPFVSMRKLAKDIGISASYLSDVETNKRKISRIMAMRVTAGLFRYTGGAVHTTFDTILMLSGLLTAERECLTRLYKMALGQNRTSLSLQLNGIYEALYGELDCYVCGKDQPNMLEQAQIIDGK